MRGNFGKELLFMCGAATPGRCIQSASAYQQRACCADALSPCLMLSHGGCCVCVGGGVLLSLRGASDAQLCKSAGGQITHERTPLQPPCARVQRRRKTTCLQALATHATGMQQLPCARNHTQATLDCVAARQCTMGMCRVCDGCAVQPRPRRRRSEMLHTPNHRTPVSWVPWTRRCCSAAVAPCTMPCTRV